LCSFSCQQGAAALVAQTTSAVIQQYEPRLGYPFAFGTFVSPM